MRWIAGLLPAVSKPSSPETTAIRSRHEKKTAFHEHAADAVEHLPWIGEVLNYPNHQSYIESRTVRRHAASRLTACVRISAAH